ncbi:MAG: rSAM-associated Gly-rich repeat protein [Aphanocapsa sp. GSE-SYN-MK-11-07L]|nr:rSAM-associated Gly-rich repeat protein [Aphanocapsa sp. GSE-SYN-MK-11-07L]
MNATTTTGLVGFLLALSTLNLPKAEAAASPDELAAPQTVEARLSALTETLRQKEAQLDTVPPETLPSAIEDVMNLARVSWGNGNGRGAWRNGGFRNGGFRNGDWNNGGFRNGGFRNGGWRNGGWRDGGGFVNLRL